MKSKQLELLKKHLPLLRHISKCNSKECKHLMMGMSDEVIKLIAQVGVNIMNKNLSIKNKQAVARLARYKKQLKGLTKSSTNTKQKRKILEQEGGFIGTLLGLAVPLISSLVGRLIKH